MLLGVSERLGQLVTLAAYAGDLAERGVRELLVPFIEQALMLGSRPFGSPLKPSELDALLADPALKQLAVAGSLGGPGGDPLLDVADEGLEPGEHLGFGDVGRDGRRPARATRLTHGSANVVASARIAAGVEWLPALPAECDPPQQIVLYGGTPRPPSLDGGRIEPPERSRDALPSFGLDEGLMVPLDAFTVCGDPASVIGVLDGFADPLRGPLLATNGAHAVSVQRAGDGARRVPGLDHREDALDHRGAIGVYHAAVDDPAVALGHRLAVFVQLGRELVAVVHGTTHHLARLPAAPFPGPAREALARRVLSVPLPDGGHKHGIREGPVVVNRP